MATGRLPPQSSNIDSYHTPVTAVTNGRASRFVSDWSKVIQLPPPVKFANLAEPSKVQIWIAPVDALNSSSLRDSLTTDETVEFGRIQVNQARDSIAAGRILLRTALSEAVGGRIPPQQWLFNTCFGHKPTVAAAMPQFQFSVTHTERLCAVAISPTLTLGIDAETVEQNVEDRLVEHFCCAREQHILRNLPSDQSSREFIRLWTLKEAYLKMTGLAEQLDLSSLGSSLGPTRVFEPENPTSAFPSHFETLFVANGHGLTHISLAIGLLEPIPAQVHLQVVSLREEEPNSTLAIPCVPSQWLPAEGGRNDLSA
jgi:4'-phosphopantetheinyl transferase